MSRPPKTRNQNLMTCGKCHGAHTMHDTTSANKAH